MNLIKIPTIKPPRRCLLQVELLEITLAIQWENRESMHLDVYISKLKEMMGTLLEEKRAKQLDPDTTRMARWIRTPAQQRTCCSNHDTLTLQVVETLQAAILKRTKAQRFRNLSITTFMKVPAEIWAGIFQILLPADDFVKPDSKDAPLVLTQVCKHWRDVALSTPILWSSLSVSILFPVYRCSPLLDMWLSRSTTMPLSLEVSWFPPRQEDPVEFDTHILPHIVSCTPRLRNLRLTLPDTYAKKILHNLMPNLDRLALSLQAEGDEMDIQPFIPRLREISILNVHMDHLALGCPWHQLRSITLRCCLKLNDCVQVLKQCTSLTHCTLRVICTSASVDTLRLLYLQSLTLLVGVNEYPGSFLDILVTPSLSTVEVSVPAAYNDHHLFWPSTSLAHLVTRSSCRLRKLRLKGFRVTESSLLTFIKQAPTLDDVSATCKSQDVLPPSIKSLLSQNC